MAKAHGSNSALRKQRTVYTATMVACSLRPDRNGPARKGRPPDPRGASYRSRCAALFLIGHLRSGTIAAAALVLLPACGPGLRGTASESLAPHGVLVTEDATTWPAQAYPSLEQDVTDSSGDGTRRWLNHGERLEHTPGRLPTRAHQRLPAEDYAVLPLPAHLGGGFLFGTLSRPSRLWHASSWTAPLHAIATATQAMTHWFASFNHVLLNVEGDLFELQPDSWQIVPATHIPAAPTLQEFVAIDDFFGAATTPPLGIQVTFDAGNSWSLLSDARTVGAKLDREGQWLTFATEKHRVLLARSGRMWEAPPSPPEVNVGGGPISEASRRAHVQSESAAFPLGRDPLATLLSNGLPLRNRRALGYLGGTLGIVNLTTGTLTRHRHDSKLATKDCRLINWSNAAGLYCLDAETSLYRIDRNLTPRFVRRFPTQRALLSANELGLTLSGGCSSARGSKLFAHIAPGGACWQYQPHTPEAAQGRSGVSVASSDDGQFWVLSAPTDDTSGTLEHFKEGQLEEVALVWNGAFNRQLAQKGTWLPSLQLLSDGRVGTWAVQQNRYAGMVVGADGRVQVHPVDREASETTFQGKIAVHASALSGAVAISTDLGATFRTLEPLRADNSRSDVPPERAWCSLVGCEVGGIRILGYGIDDDAVVPAPDPPPLSLRPTRYDDWRFDCSAQPPIASPHRPPPNSPASRTRFAVGFGPSTQPLGSFEGAPPAADFQARAGLPPPRVDASLRLARHSVVPTHYSAFAWAPSPATWRSDAEWRIQVADPFSESSWQTASSMVPWWSPEQAHGIMGSDQLRTPRWSLELSTTEAGGLLLTGDLRHAQLHVLEPNKPIRSFADVEGFDMSGAARLDERWYFGRQQGSAFHIFRLEAQGPAEIRILELGNPQHHAQLIGAADGSQLALRVRAQQGHWYVFALGDDLEIVAQRHYVPSQLDAPPKPCVGPPLGFVSVESVPLMGTYTTLLAPRLRGVSPGHFEGQLFARVELREKEICLTALSARTSSLPNDSAQGPSAGIPLILREQQRGRTKSYRCTAATRGRTLEP